MINIQGNQYTLLCNLVIDYITFYNGSGSRSISGKSVYPYNYEYSTIRAWLNGYDGSSYKVEDYTNKGFYDIAFNNSEKKFINTTLVNNGEDTVQRPDKVYTCNNTNDKVYLLSYADVNGNYAAFSGNDDRKAVTSDYGRLQGQFDYKSTANEGASYWYLRSPYYYNYVDYPEDRAAHISMDGSNGGMMCDFTSGVRPAIIITIK